MSALNSEVRWLHISDFHFKEAESYDRDVVTKSFLKSLPGLIDKFGKPHFIVANGDIGYSGKKGEYAQATKFFDRLLELTELKKDKLFVVPGNHDVDRMSGRGLARTLNSNEDSDHYFDSSDSLLHISQRQKAYKQWFDFYFNGIRTFADNSSANEICDLIDLPLTVSIACLNTAIFCFDDNDSGKLWLGRRSITPAIDQLINSRSDIKLIVMHHPIPWLNNEEATNIKSVLRDSADCILTGHLHETDIEQVTGLVGNTVHIAAGAVYQTRRYPNTASICAISKKELSILPIKYNDKPVEIWTIDPSIFPNNNDYVGRFKLNRSDSISRTYSNSASDIEINTNEQANAETPSLTVPPKVVVPLTTVSEDYEQDLFKAPSGQLLYVKPRIREKSQRDEVSKGISSNDISLDAIVNGSNSIIIECQPESGSTLLTKTLRNKSQKRGIQVVLKSARELPNYKKKLEVEFHAVINDISQKSMLIVDDFDFERDEKLLKELRSGNWFTRIIIIHVNRSVDASGLTEIPTADDNWQYLYLWNITRGDIRELATVLFDSSDDVFLSSIVDKVYQDLLGLCIPLTPLNVIMYLRILFREGEFHPLNRVDLVGRYLQELLRRPSDAYSGTFNAKNKLDVVSAFAHRLWQDEDGEFTVKTWLDFCSKFKSDTLSDFDEQSLLQELFDSRVIIRFQAKLYFKYSFFYTYFLGRYIAGRANELSAFMQDDQYLKLPGLIDVITGISSDNRKVVVGLTKKLNELLLSFSQQYIKADFDPISGAIWPSNEEKDEELWLKIQSQIESAPSSTSEIDVLKTSLMTEVRTTDQQVRFEKFLAIENALFLVEKLLIDAFRNSDDVSGDMKLDALDAILRTELVAYQIGALFAPILSKRRYFRWGGLVFIDFNNLTGTDAEDAHNNILSVIIALSGAVSGRIAEQLGAHKLGPVFTARAARGQDTDSRELMVFTTTMAAKGKNWNETCMTILNRTDKNAFVLSEMLSACMNSLKNEILKTKDRESTKRLVALIRSKRDVNKNSPGSKLISRMLAHLEKIEYFEDIPDKKPE